MTDTKKLTVNGLEVEFTDERNLLEVIRKAGIDLPTFCYHSELSIYGACRLCLVLVEGRGIMAACSLKTSAAPTIFCKNGADKRASVVLNLVYFEPAATISA